MTGVEDVGLVELVDPLAHADPDLQPEAVLVAERTRTRQRQLQQPPQSPQRVVFGGHQRLHPCQKPLLGPGEAGQQQRLLGAEDAADDGVRRARLAGDVLQPHVSQTVLGDQPDGRLQDGVDGRVLSHGGMLDLP